jgi:hypothetical protein
LFFLLGSHVGNEETYFSGYLSLELLNIVSLGETAVGMDHADRKKKIVFFWDVDFVNFL